MIMKKRSVKAILARLKGKTQPPIMSKRNDNVPDRPDIQHGSKSNSVAQPQTYPFQASEEPW